MRLLMEMWVGEHVGATAVPTIAQSNAQSMQRACMLSSDRSVR